MKENALENSVCVSGKVPRETKQMNCKVRERERERERL